MNVLRCSDDIALTFFISRPPYHGTWSKRRAVKGLGRKPFTKEPILDYDVDSEAEWEEGDDLVMN